MRQGMIANNVRGRILRVVRRNKEGKWEEQTSSDFGAREIGAKEECNK